MRKNAFTLIELLAVIVILAIIAVIAVPIVIDIITDSKEKSNKEGLNLYIDTVSKRIANSNLDVLYNPDTCTIQSTGDLLCLKNDEELYVDEEKTNKILEIKMNGKKPTEGSLYFTDGKITTGENIKYNNLYYTITNGTVSKGSNEKTDIITGVVARIKNAVGNISGTCEIQNTTTMICGSETKTLQQSGHKVTEGIIIFNDGEIERYANLKMEGKYYHQNTSEEKSETDKKKYGILIFKNGLDDYNKGDKYTYKVNDVDTFNFYVLTEPVDGKVNLIMDRNICNDGTTNYTSANNYCKCAWYLAASKNTYGPVTATQVLYNATKNWNNVLNMEINYQDEGNNDKTDMGYTSFVVNNGVATIIGKPESNITTIGTSAKPLKARLPKQSEVAGAGCTGNNGSCPIWLMENMTYSNVSNDKYSMNNNTEVYQNKIYGYWLLSSRPGEDYRTYYLGNNGSRNNYTGTSNTTLVGARPVITVSVSDLSN